MPWAAGMDLNFSKESYDPITMITALHQANGCFDDHGQKSYLPLHDEDNFDWQFDAISEDELLS